MSKVITILLLIIFLLYPAGLKASSFDELIQQKRQELEAIQEQINQYRAEISEKREEARSLEREIDIINAQINQVELQIKETELAIEETDLAISAKKEGIEIIEERIDYEKTFLAEYLRIIYQYDKQSILEIMLRQEKLSDFFAEVNALENVQEETQKTLERVKSIKWRLEKEKEELEEEKAQQNSLRTMQELQRRSLTEQTNTKERLISITKGQEARFQNMISQGQDLYRQISSEIYMLQSLGDPISFEDAQREAQFASSITGVRTSFLLAMLKVESNLGTNIGGGNYLTDMSPYQRPAFLEICQELGLTPEKMPVSRKPTSYSGWGGAMGPAQFMPITWLSYKDKVASLTGHNPPNPWNLRDAMTAMAVKLGGVSGVVGGNREAEYKAAGLYFAGSNWQKFTWYSDRVAWYSDIYQDILNK